MTAEKTPNHTMPPKERRKVSAPEDRSRDPNPPTKLDRMVVQLMRPEGASLAEFTTVTGWQAHYADARIMPM